MERASEALLALKPVTFRYKKGLIRQTNHSLDWWPKTWKK